MISVILTEENTKKLEILDKLVEAFTAEELDKIIESNDIIARLQNGTKIKNPFLKDTFNSVGTLRMENSMLQSRVITLETDMKCLIRILNGIIDNQYRCEFDNLKRKHNVY